MYDIDCVSSVPYGSNHVHDSWYHSDVVISAVMTPMHLDWYLTMPSVNKYKLFFLQPLTVNSQACSLKKTMNGGNLKCIFVGALHGATSCFTRMIRSRCGIQQQVAQHVALCKGTLKLCVAIFL